jgi:hypothetical protein
MIIGSVTEKRNRKIRLENSEFEYALTKPDAGFTGQQMLGSFFLLSLPSI